jgi:hypothetical protein
MRVDWYIERTHREGAKGAKDVRGSTIEITEITESSL